MQRAVKHARRELGLSVLPHELRHGYATHCLERGANPRAIQQAMGHASLETTMGYLHTESLSVLSPLEVLEAAPAPASSFNYVNRTPFQAPALSSRRIPPPGEHTVGYIRSVTPIQVDPLTALPLIRPVRKE